MLTKSYPCKIKAAEGDAGGGLEPGQFEAIVSVFNNVDSVGDIVVPGAFKDTLAAWKAKGDPIPVIWSHQHANPDAHIGTVLEAEEKPEGLWVKAQLDLADDDGTPLPFAQKVNRLLKGRRVTQFSFAYDVLDGGMVKNDGESVFELRKLDLFEVGPTLVGANSETDLIAAKSLGDVATALRDVARQAKAGRVLSASNEAGLKAALTSIADGVASIEAILAAASDASKAHPVDKPDEPSGVKGKDRPGLTPASVLQLVELDLEFASL